MSLLMEAPIVRTRVSRRKKSIYEGGTRDLVAAGQHLVATVSTRFTPQEQRDRAIVLVRLGIREGNNIDLMEALGLIPGKQDIHGESDTDGVCVCGWSVAPGAKYVRAGLTAHVTRKGRRS